MWTTKELEVIEAIKRGKEKIKTIEAQQIPKEKQTNSAWLIAINDIIDRTGLAIRDELIND